MKAWNRRVIFGWCAVALVAQVALVVAKGPPARVAVTGEGITGEIIVDDAALLAELGMVELMDISQQVDEPVDAGDGYTLVRYALSGQTTYVPFDSAIYYPQAGDGHAYVYYIGITNGWSEYDRRWFPATASGDAAMRALLAQEGVALPAAAPARERLLDADWVRLLSFFRERGLILFQ